MNAAVAKANGSLTSEQVVFYSEEGYLVLPQLLTDADMAPAREAMQAKVAQIADELFSAGQITDRREDSPFEYRLAELFAGKSDADFLTFGRSWRDRLPGYFDLMANPKILDAVESLIGEEIFANPVYNTRPKVPGVAAGAVPWHQDKSYWPDANSNPVITVWIRWWMPTRSTAASISGRGPIGARSFLPCRGNLPAPGIPRSMTSIRGVCGRKTTH